MARSLRTPLAATLLLALSLGLLSACGAGATASDFPSPTPTPSLDPSLFGQWTNQVDRTRISVDDDGRPDGAVTIGIWYEFRSDGRYVSVARHMTFAIGGVSVEEGRYVLADTGLRLSGRTWSFFPDEGSPQKKQYREKQEDASLAYRLAREEGVDVLYLSMSDRTEVRFAAVAD